MNIYKLNELAIKGTNLAQTLPDSDHSNDPIVEAPTSIIDRNVKSVVIPHLLSAILVDPGIATILNSHARAGVGSLGALELAKA